MGWLGRLDLPAQLGRWVPPWLTSLVIGAILFELATLMRSALNLVWPTAVPFGFVLPMILLATIIGRWLAGLTCYLLGAVFIWLYIGPQLESAGLGDTTITAVLILYLLVGGTLLLIAEAYRRSERALRREQVLRAQSETDRQRLLAQELSHRIKNMLTTVQAIASQTLGKSGVAAEVRTAFENRLVALGRAHDLLTGSAWRAVPLDQLVADAILAFDEGGRFQTAGPAIALPPRQAIAIALALHELATNALKYGALAAPAGKVDIVWQLDGDGFRLTWTEQGGPPVKRPGRAGFGTRLLKHNLAAELGGKVKLEFASTGFRWEISSPSVYGPE